MRYYGSKEKLLDFIEKAVNETGLNKGVKFVDLFTGTTSVAKHFKKLGYRVIANDFLESSYALAKAYIELNEVPRFNKLGSFVKGEITAGKIISYLNDIPGRTDFITKNYSPYKKNSRKYFTVQNAKRVDAIRTKIYEWEHGNLINELEKYYLITSLLESINLVSNVAGTYGAYLKDWDKRALNRLKLTSLEIIESKKNNKAYKEDANELIKSLNCDILYLDPPYNTRQFASNYFLPELIAEGWFDTKPKIYGKSGMRPYDEQKSLFSMKSRAKMAFRELIETAKANYILLSYSNEGIIPHKEIVKILKQKGCLRILSEDHRRYKSVNQKKSAPTHTIEKIYLVKTKKMLKRANKLDGSAWLKNSFSVWRGINKSKEERQLEHPAMFPIDLVEKCIDSFSHREGALLDPFAGSGSSLIAGLKNDMDVYGFDISNKFKNTLELRLKNNYKNLDQIKCQYMVEDSRNLDEFLKKSTIDICITSPPYWDILNQKRTADNKESRNYSDLKTDIGNLSNYQLFLKELKAVMRKVHWVLKPEAYCVLVVMDIRKKSNFYSFHSDCIDLMREVGYSLEDIIIWDRQHEYNNCRPLGYPYKFVINKVHEYLLIFRR